MSVIFVCHYGCHFEGVSWQSRCGVGHCLGRNSETAEELDKI